MITEIFSIGDKILDRVIPDKNARAAAKEELEKLDQRGELNLLLGQLEINKKEAEHKSIFVAGWRPAVGWVCVIILVYNYIIYPTALFFTTVSMDSPPNLLSLDATGIMPVILGMLGLSGYRSFEKTKNVARNN